MKKYRLLYSNDDQDNDMAASEEALEFGPYGIKDLLTICQVRLHTEPCL
jgi:hypothetical protein